MTVTPPGIANAKSVLIIGATSGIGRALARSIKSLPSKPTVIVAGRRKERLEELSKDGFETAQFDVTVGREALRTFAKNIVAKYPDFDTVIFSSGIQRSFDFKHPEALDLDTLEEELNTNYVAIATLITFFLPHFLKLSVRLHFSVCSAPNDKLISTRIQEQGLPSFIVPVTSNLGITPGPWVPNYCATKAALRSLGLSLHFQLQDTNVHVMEIIPPLVESELHDNQGMTGTLSRFWMPLEAFTDATMQGLLRGDLAIAPGRSGIDWEAWEKGKAERVTELMKNRV
ncbi:hypothetical protein B0H21DRAFT_424112 [Amylocystis lapponica]|nr:hypothetical protein B0H21DRAFT_424112 [Amylocystis lapponica]